MILKGSQCGGGQDLAVHLMRLDDNDHVELRGFAFNNLKGAFKEAEAVSRGTKCGQYLFSLSLNPPEEARADVAAFTQTIDHIEEKLGLAGQPRAIVFHEKEGRRHGRCVWSRIDAQSSIMTRVTARRAWHRKSARRLRAKQRPENARRSCRRPSRGSGIVSRPVPGIACATRYGSQSLR
jgi:hypothetical protein